MNDGVLHVPHIQFLMQWEPNPVGNCLVIDCTSRSDTAHSQLSPFKLGPVKLWGGHVAKNVENAWQFSKVYPIHMDWNAPHLMDLEKWMAWASSGWSDHRAHRYPMGRCAQPIFSYWDGERLSYVEARKKIYVPLYATAVQKTALYHSLYETLRHNPHRTVVIKDFDVYPMDTTQYDWFDTVLDNPHRKCGHGFVLGAMLQGRPLPNLQRRT